MRPSGAISCSNPSPYVPRSFSTSRSAQQRVDELGPLVVELLERGGVGGVAGLGLLPAQRPRSVNSSSRSCTGELKLRSSRPTTLRNSAPRRSISSIRRTLIERSISRSTAMPTCSMRASTRTRGFSMSRVEPGHALRFEGGLDGAGDVMHGECLAPGQLRHVERAAVEIELTAWPRRRRSSAG